MGIPLQDHVEKAMLRVTDVMREGLGDPLTLDDLAEAAMFSKFHFSRMFLSATGISPGRFLSALRLAKAKELLLTTDWNVVDIGIRVGYASVGTFSTRFSRSVGLSPTEYRRRKGFAPCAEVPGQANPGGRRLVQGRIRHRLDAPTRPVFVGLFAGPVPEGEPIKSTIVHSGDDMFALSTPHEGDCHLVAFSTSSGKGHALVDEPERLVASKHLGALRHRDAVTRADLDLLPKSPLDLPILIAMPVVTDPLPLHSLLTPGAPAEAAETRMRYAAAVPQSWRC
jgi:AraC-like DNA-binding protein